jgi:hypothetical protein
MNEQHTRDEAKAKAEEARQAEVAAATRFRAAEAERVQADEEYADARNRADEFEGCEGLSFC